jgi:putative transposase
MKKSRFTESPIVSRLAQHVQGHRISDLCRAQGISQPMFYQWQLKYAGMKVNVLKRLKELEAELRQFERIAVDLTLQNRVLKKSTAYSFKV